MSDTDTPKSNSITNSSTDIPETAIPPKSTTESEAVELPEPVIEVEVSVKPAPAPETDSELIVPTMSKRKEQNVTLDTAASKIDFENKDEEVDFALPSETSARTEEVVKSMPNVDFTSDKDGDRWVTTVRKSLGLHAYDDTFLSTLEDPNADFYQSLEFNGTIVGSSEAKFKEKQNTIFSGEQAVLRTISHLGLGTTWNVGLYNTGVWVTFKPPAEEDLVELYRQLTSDQIVMGRMSYGLAFANTSAYTIDRMCQFATNFIYRVNSDQNEIGPSNILQHLKAQDIPSLLWGFACTMFPRGFSYSRACMANPEKCQHVTNEQLNLRKLQLVNRNGLSDRQKAHMAEHRSQTKLTVKDLQQYESEMLRAQAHRIIVNEGKKNEIVFNLRSPSIAEYIETGHRWIDDMVNNVEKVIDSSGTTEEKNRLVDLRANATIMRQYSHWIASIEFDTNKIEDRDTIEKTVGQVSSDPDIREAFLSEVKKFIENSSVSVIGIPTYDCPACGKANEGPLTYPHRTTMIPIDVVQLFFALLTRNMLDLQSR